MDVYLKHRLLGLLLLCNLSIICVSIVMYFSFEGDREVDAYVILVAMEFIRSM